MNKPITLAISLIVLVVLIVPVVMVLIKAAERRMVRRCVRQLLVLQVDAEERAKMRGDFAAGIELPGVRLAHHTLKKFAESIGVRVERA